MNESENGEGGGEEKAKRTRNVRPIFLMIPLADGTAAEVAYEMFKCKGLPEVRKLLADKGLDPTDPRVERIVLLRGEEMPFEISQQVVFKFGSKAAG